MGTYAIDGGGSNATQRALDLRDLGYRVALFIDADVPLDSERRTDLEQAGVKIVEWANGLNTEQRICQDLPLTALCELVKVASEGRGEDSVRDGILARLGAAARGDTLRAVGLDLDQWKVAGVVETDLRPAIAATATVKDKEWFKRIGPGERLGEIVARALPEIPDSDLAAKITALEEWAHGD